MFCHTLWPSITFRVTVCDILSHSRTFQGVPGYSIMFYHVLQCSICVLGSAILPPSRIPEWNPIVPYVVRPCLSSTSVWLPPHSRTYHPVTSVHLVASHPSLIPPIFLHVRLIYPDFLWIHVSCVIFPVPPSLYLSLVLCILSSPESTLLLSILSALI